MVCGFCLAAAATLPNCRVSSCIIAHRGSGLRCMLEFEKVRRSYWCAEDQRLHVAPVLGSVDPNEAFQARAGEECAPTKVLKH